MEAALRFLANGAHFTLGESQLIGRRPECQICIPDKRISSEHAIIRRHASGSYWLTDLRSRNGTRMNGKLVTGSVKLQGGDELRFGNTCVEFITEVPTLDTGTYGGLTQTEEARREGEALFLVSDVREFTQKCETLPASTLADIMLAWYRDVRSAIESHQGTVDKFLGDAVLAFWYDIGPAAHGQALEAASAVARIGKQINSKFSNVLDSHAMIFDTGVALHRGDFAHGPIGGVDFTLLGKGVTVAFRLESLTRASDCRVVASGQFLSGCPDGILKVRSLGLQKLKGVTEAIEVFRLDLDEPPIVPSEDPESLATSHD